LFSLPRNGSVRNSDCLHLILFYGKEFRAFFSSVERFAERNSEDFLFRGTAGIPPKQTNSSVYSVFRGIIFLSEIANPSTHPMGVRIPLMMFSSLYTVAKFILPDWMDKVDSGTGLWSAGLCSLEGRYYYGMGLSYRPAGLHRLADRYHNPMPESNIPQSGTLIWLL
jgi:hypothetical protein